MKRSMTRSRMAGFVLTTALASSLVAGCATSNAPRADLSASRAEVALKSGKTQTGIEHAEAAVLADPRNAAYRVTLGSAYLQAGRFQSAATAFDDAMSLGDHASRTALSLALSHIAMGDSAKARAVLDEWGDVIAPADLGLAYALVGQPDRAVMILVDALRGGEDTAKVRQNLAYSYALAGQWMEARLMAAQDVPADKLEARIDQWARTAQPEAARERVAMLLAVPGSVKDPGQPTALALSSSTTPEQLAAEAQAAVPSPQIPYSPDLAAAPQPEKATVTLARYEPAPSAVAQNFEASVAPAPRLVAASAVAASPRQAAGRAAHAKPARQGFVATRTANSVGTGKILGTANKAGTGNHLVQLGSFTSAESAKRAWAVYSKRYPGLASHALKMTQARVNGRAYWRVSAAGFDRLSAISMCAQVRRAGRDGCLAYSARQPLPGTVG